MRTIFIIAIVLANAVFAAKLKCRRVPKSRVYRAINTNGGNSNQQQQPPAQQQQPPAQQQPVTPSAPSLSRDEQDILNGHNDDRAKYGMPALSWDDGLKNDAQNYANRLAAAGCRLDHATGNAANTNSNFNNFDSSVNGEGENLAFQANTGGSLNTMAELFTLFINGPDEVVPPTSDTTIYNHHTQILWKRTSRVGCAIARGTYSLPGYICQSLVCRYRTPGNYVGQNWNNPAN